MKSPNGLYDFEKHYLGDEKNNMLKLERDQALSYAERRHTKGAARTARRRIISEHSGTPGMVPPRLYDICLRLGIIRNTTTRAADPENKKKSAIESDVFSFLCSLPGAANMDEKMWLETPEIWCFASPHTVYKSYTGDGRKIRDVIEEKKHNWCDKWISYADIPGEMRKRISGQYIIPYESAAKIMRYHGKKREEAFGITFFPYSLISREKYECEFTEGKLNVLKAKLKEKPVGYVSYIYNVPVSYLLSLKAE